MKHVIVLIGAGQIGQAIARRVGIGKHVLLADVRAENAAAAADVLSNAGFEVSTATVDVSSRDAVHALAEQAASTGSSRTGRSPRRRRRSCSRSRSCSSIRSRTRCTPTNSRSAATRCA